MKRRSYALGICWLLVTGFVWVAGLGAAEDETPFERARREIQDAIERERIPSLAVAVARGDQFLWEEGFGWADREQQIKATPHTPYSIASISKPITATALMMLVEQGLIDLDQPANKYLGDAKLVAHAGDAQDATIRRLANHTAGLPLHYQFFYADEARRVPPFEESIRRYGHLLAPPGEEYQYANFGYGVLDQIVQRVSKRSYAEFLEQELFRPLGMQHTAVGIRTDWSPAAAIRYSGGSPLPFYDFDHPGASAVFSSAHDLVRFGLFHLGLRPEDKAKPPARDLLSSESRAEMRRGTADCGGGRRYGVGWFVDPNEFGYETVSHTGGMGGVRCRLVLVPDLKIVVATLCNTSSDVPLEISREVLAALLPDYGERWRT
ncbi:MAG: serine hydrolase domain-containing protein, partial [Pirellulaceae bacterium]